MHWTQMFRNLIKRWWNSRVPCARARARERIMSGTACAHKATLYSVSLHAHKVPLCTCGRRTRRSPFRLVSPVPQNNNKTRASCHIMQSKVRNLGCKIQLNNNNNNDNYKNKWGMKSRRCHHVATALVRTGIRSPKRNRKTTAVGKDTSVVVVVFSSCSSSLVKRGVVTSDGLK